MLDMTELYNWSVVIRPLGISLIIKNSKYAGLSPQLNNIVMLK